MWSFDCPLQSSMKRSCRWHLALPVRPSPPRCGSFLESCMKSSSMTASTILQVSISLTATSSAPEGDSIVSGPQWRQVLCTLVKLAFSPEVSQAQPLKLRGATLHQPSQELPPCIKAAGPGYTLVNGFQVSQAPACVKTWTFRRCWPSNHVMHLWEFSLKGPCVASFIKQKGSFWICFYKMFFKSLFLSLVDNICLNVILSILFIFIWKGNRTEQDEALIYHFSDNFLS